MMEITTEKTSYSLTDQQYWEEYYKSTVVDADIVRSVCSQYDLFWDLFINAADSRAKTLIEVGAFPGRYLAYLASKYQLRPTGIDFNPATAIVDRMMKSMRVESYDYICTDFLQHKPDRQFDLVFSNGFVEHFFDYNTILDKHLDYLKPGGALMIMIPNKTHLRRLYGYLVDYDNLMKHNLTCMELSVFRAFAERNDLKTIHLDYYGGFAFKVHQPLNLFQRTLYWIIRKMSIRFNEVLSRRPSKWYSGTIIAIFSKP